MTLVVYDSRSIISSLYQASRVVHVGGTIQKEFMFHQKGSGTGGLIWPASELLSNYLAQDAIPVDILNGINWSEQNILELGAGLGVLSTSLLHLGSRVFATDGMANVVDQLADNLRINTHNTLLERFTCSILEWGDMESLRSLDPFREGRHGVDIVMASDVVYGEDQDVWNGLAATLHEVCRIRNNYIVENDSGCLNPTIVLLAQVSSKSQHLKCGS
jgi:hypothetical protein